MTDDAIVDAADLLVREYGRDAAEAELAERVTNAAPESDLQARAQAALAALRNGEVTRDD